MVPGPGAATASRQLTARRLFRCGRVGRRTGAAPGQATILIAGTMVILTLVAGLVIDAGQVFERYRHAYNLADGAARAGANELDMARYRDPNNATGAIVLDPAAAIAAAIAWLAPETGTIRVVASPVTGLPDGVEVTVTQQAPTAFLRLAGITSWQVRATATSRLRTG